MRPPRPPPSGSPVRRGRLAGDHTGTGLSASVPPRPAGLRDQGGASGQSETLVTAGPRLSQFWSRTFSIPHGVPDSRDRGSLAADVCGWRWVGTVTGLRGSSRGVLTGGQGGAAPPPLPRRSWAPPRPLSSVAGAGLFVPLPVQTLVRSLSEVMEPCDTRPNVSKFGMRRKGGRASALRASSTTVLLLRTQNHAGKRGSRVQTREGPAPNTEHSGSTLPRGVLCGH